MGRGRFDDDGIMGGDFRKLPVWQKAMELVTEVYKVSGTFPRIERFGLVPQMRQAAVSIPSTIAAGQGRSSIGEFHESLGKARGHLYEVETQLEIAGNLGFMEKEEVERLVAFAEKVVRLLNTLMRSLRDSSN